MRLPVLLLFVVASFLLAAQPAGPSTDPALQGNWSIVTVEVNGQSLPMDKLLNARLDIAGERYFVQIEDIKLELTFTVDPMKMPKTIDLMVMEGKDKGKVYHGIYKVENGLYTICRSTEPGMERPMAFATTPKSGLMMVVWKAVDRSPK